MERIVSVIGGDRRQAELARLLREDGSRVCTYGLERWKAEGAGSLEDAVQSEVILLPMPLCREEGQLNCEGCQLSTRELFRKLRPDQRVLAGQVGDAQRQEADAFGIRLEDYLEREDLTILNASLTAEAAIQVAMEQREEALWGAECLVLGFGRIGKLLTHRLAGMGARVTATARKAADLAWIRAYGVNALETGKLDGRLSQYDVVFNTIPSMVLDRSLLAQLPQNCLCVELASKPGMDLAAAEELGLAQVWARGLPGRMRPCAAAALLRDTINQILWEKGDSI